MRRIFVTGATGYLGGYACTQLLARDPEARLALMVRARDPAQAVARLWHGWQLHLDRHAFAAALERVELVPGDLTADDLGLEPTHREALVRDTDSVLHIAASLNRKSARACFDVNLRGTLSVIRLARAMADGGGLRRFSMVSTAAVAGERWREVVTEPDAVSFARRQYDPYARTKAFTEHMAKELLPDVSRVVFRPSTVLGDSRFPQTTQWDMVRAFVFFATLPALPWGPDIRQDIVNADYVGEAIARVHLAETPRFDTYHLSAGTGSPTSAEVMGALVAGTGRRPPRFLTRLQGPFAGSVDALDQWGPGPTRSMAALLKVFLPYVTNDTVFDNTRIVTELGHAPTPFVRYCSGLLDYARRHDFHYPHLPVPSGLPAPSGPTPGGR